MNKHLSTRSRTDNTIQYQKIFFIGNEIRTCDSNSYNERRQACSEFESAADRLMKSLHHIDKRSEFFEAKQSGESKDIYSAEICCHRSYYPCLLYQKNGRDELQERMHQDALNDFFRKLNNVLSSKALLIPCMNR